MYPCINRPLLATVLMIMATLSASVVTVMAQAQASTVQPAASTPNASGRAVAMASPGKAALSVNVVQVERGQLPLAINANGSIAAWQEASVGAEASGWRLAEVRVDVGDTVRKGQVLAVFAPEMIRADLAQAEAALAEGEATLAEAGMNALRARELQASGALSAQQINQYYTAERTAAARVQAQRAAVQVQQLRVVQTQVLAPDHGVISARTATVGAVVPAGQELFRLIRGARLEWRAEVAATDLSSIKVGQTVRITPSGAPAINGRVRMLAPTVDVATRNALVFVDLPAPGAARAGMFARGEFDLGQSAAATLPQSAVLMRDGFAWVFKVQADLRVSQTKVGVGRRIGERVEIVSGIAPGDRIVATGAGFLSDGDLVRVVGSPAATPAVQR